MTSEITHKGETLFESTGTSYKVSQYGVVYASHKYLLASSRYTIAAAQRWATTNFGELHDVYAHLRCVNASCSTNGPFHEVTLVYQGLPTNAKHAIGRISAQVTTEPIDTHPDFEDFAGKKGSEKNEAIFNDDGTFKAFKIHKECPRPKDNNKAGVKSYLAPAMTYEVKTILGTSNNPPPDIAGIEKTPDPHSPANGKKINAPVIGKRNWLVVGFDEEPFGDGVRQTKKYRLSGRRKWNDDIYKK